VTEAMLNRFRDLRIQEVRLRSFGERQVQATADEQGWINGSALWSDTRRPVTRFAPFVLMPSGCPLPRCDRRLARYAIDIFMSAKLPFHD
jgi:hypothetical protein